MQPLFSKGGHSGTESIVKYLSHCLAHSHGPGTIVVFKDTFPLFPKQSPSLFSQPWTTHFKPQTAILVLSSLISALCSLVFDSLPLTRLNKRLGHHPSHHLNPIIPTHLAPSLRFLDSKVQPISSLVNIQQVTVTHLQSCHLLPKIFRNSAMATDGNSPERRKQAHLTIV